MQQQQKARRYVPFWLMAATTVVLVLAGLQLLAGFQQTEASPTGGRSLPARKLADDSPPSKRALRTTHTCIEARGGLPEQRVCVFHDLVLYNGRVLYVTDDANDTVPPIKISWLKKFEGDNMFQHTVVNQSQLEFNWNTAQVEEIPQAGLIHQQHYSNFYHMFSEVAPSVHFVLCKFLGDCTYSADSKTRLFFIQEKRPDIPVYIMLDSIADTFACMSPQPVWHKDDPQMQNRVYVLKKAVVGVSNEVRAFHNWEQDFQKQYREPPKAPMVAWRQRMADCFGFNFTQAVAPTNTLRILFINRHYEEGRMILNQAKLAHLIEKLPEVKEFQGLEIDLQYLNGDDTLRHQAALFWNASLLIWPHGATMAMTTFLPRGAQAVEVIPWVEEDKARHPEWVQAIRDTFSLSIDLYAVQNKERRRVMFNQDALAEYPQYRDASPEHKIALLEQGVCPPGVDGFTCPFWWNHWKVSLNLDWAVLEPTLKTALGKLIELRKAGGQLPVAAAADSAGGAAGSGKDGMLQEGAGAADAEPAGDGHDRSRSLAGSPSQQAQQRGAAAAAAGLEPAAAALLAAEGGVSQAGVPLSALSCLHDDGKAEHRLCVASNLVAYMGKLYYVTEDPAGASLPEIQISWEDWEHEKDLREDKYFAPKLVRPSELPFTWDPAQADTIDRAWLPHIVDSGNFYHILSEVLPTFFANWCKFVGVCHYQDRQGFEVLFIQPDPKRRFGLIRPLEQAWQCFSQKPPRKLIDIGSTPVLIKHGVLGIGPYMRAYEQQGFRKAWEDPPAGLMPKWLQFLSACTGTGFAAAQAPNDVLRITFVNRPWSAGRSFLNLHEVVVWLTREWLPARKLPRPFEVETATVHEWQNIEEQIAVFQRTSILVYPHGATMTHAIFLPKGSVALEVIPWPKVTEPHGWLQSIKRQYELEGLQLGLLVNKYRANLVLNWQALAWDPVWKTLTAEEKVALQEEGTCPKAHEPKCFFDWLHWKSELVLDKEQLAEKLTEALGMLGLGGTAATA